MGITATGYFGEWVSEGALNPAGNNTWTPLTTLTGFLSWPGPLVDSMELAPGTVIDLGPISHDGSQQILAWTRPLVTIGPRTVRPGSGQSIVVTATSNYPLDLSTASMSFNGTLKDPSPYLQAGGGGPGTTCWLVPASGLPSGPVTMRFSVQEDQNAVTGPEKVQLGVNVVQY